MRAIRASVAVTRLSYARRCHRGSVNLPTWAVGPSRGKATTIMAEPTQRELDELLWDACEKGDLTAAQEYKGKGADPNWMHPQKPPGRAYQFTALHIASDKGHTNIVKWLVEKGGADLNKKSPYGETPGQHCDGRAGLEEITGYLKMKAGMLAVLAAQKFAAQKKKMEEKKKEAAAN